MNGMKSKLTTIWIFAMLNYLYCDLLGLLDPNLLKQYLAGTANGIEISQTFLLGSAVLMEIPIAMVLLSRLLGYRANRWANIVAGATMTVVQIGSLFLGTPTLYYVFFSVIEMAATVSIVWIAWKWASDERAVSMAPKVAVSH